MTVQELITLHTICELERNQLLTILAMSVQNLHLAGFLLPGNCSNFLYVEGSTAWFYHCLHFLSPLYTTHRCFDRIPLHFKDTLMYVDPITRQTYDYATTITCDNNPKNIIELDPDSDDQDFYFLRPEPIKRKPPLMFTPSQIKTTIRPKTFTAQDACIYSNAELDQFWNRILFSKHSDSTLQLLGKALSCSFTHAPDYYGNSPHDNPYNTLRIGLHDKPIRLTPLFTSTWFSDAFIALFGYPCYIFTQCGIYFSTFLFLEGTITHIFKLYKTISNKYNLKNIITLFSSIAHGFFNILTSQMVNDLNDNQNKKPKNTLLKSKLLDHFSDTSTNLINHSTGLTSPPPFYTKRPNKLQIPKFKIFPKRHHFSHPKTTLQTSTLPFSPDQHPSLSNYSNNHSHPNYTLATPHDTLTNAPVLSNTDTPNKIYSRVNYHFPPPSSRTPFQSACQLSSGTLLYSFKLSSLKSSSHLLLILISKLLSNFIFLKNIVLSNPRSSQNFSF